jgi:Na+/H+ antiporter
VQVLEVILILLAIAAILRLVSIRLSVPQPVLLVLGGLALAVIPGLPHFQPDPGVVFLIFIPPLLYRAALETSLRDFKRNLRSISLLAFGLVLVTMCAVAWAAHTLIPGMSWSSGFVLGAIVSPPDAVSVTAITRRLKLPVTIATVLEGESLVNDATALIAYRMGVAAVVAGAFSFLEAGLRFILTGMGAIIFGLGMGWLIARIRKFIGFAPVVENTISLLTPFAVFIPAERLGLASILAVVSTGLYLGRQGPRIVSARTRIQAAGMWEILVFILEGLIFILIGLELPVVLKSIGNHSFLSTAYYTVIISIVLIAIRLAWIFPAAFFSARRAPPWKSILFVGWAGMRGGDSLVIALTLPMVTASGSPFPGRDLIIFLTFGVILVSLIVQGLSLKAVIRLLKLQADGTADTEEANARLKSARAGLDRLNQLLGERHDPSPAAERLRNRYNLRVKRLEENAKKEKPEADSSRDAEFICLRLEMIAAERAEVIRLRDNDEIGDDAMRIVQQDLDLEEVLLSADEIDPEE